MQIFVIGMISCHDFAKAHYCYNIAMSPEVPKLVTPAEALSTNGFKDYYVHHRGLLYLYFKVTDEVHFEWTFRPESQGGQNPDKAKTLGRNTNLLVCEILY